VIYDFDREAEAILELREGIWWARVLWETQVDRSEEVLRDELSQVDFPPQLGAGGSHFVLELLTRLGSGSVVPAADFERSLGRHGVAAPEREVIQRYCEFDGSGDVVGAFGISLGRRSCRIETGGRELGAWCPADALVLPSILHKEVIIREFCPATDTEIVARVGPDDVVDVQPPSAILTVRGPVEEVLILPSMMDVIDRLCRYQHLYRDLESAVSARSGYVMMFPPSRWTAYAAWTWRRYLGPHR